MSSTEEKRSEAGKKGAEALKEKHESEGLTEAERRQREEAGRKGGQH
jgi:general stress protein YciG